MSQSNVVLDSSNSSLPAVPDTSASTNLPSGPIAISTVPSGPVGGVKRFATGGVNLRSSQYGQSFTFKEHTQAASFASLFGACYVERVTITLTSLIARSTDSAPWVFRFGVVPRGTPNVVSDVANADNIPWLHHFIAGSTLHYTTSITFARFPGANELPFPPGLQLDLNATEIRFKYPTPVVMLSNPSGADKKDVCKWNIEFELRGEGTVFGA